jgi:hypothetical protein
VVLGVQVVVVLAQAQGAQGHLAKGLQVEIQQVVRLVQVGAVLVLLEQIMPKEVHTIMELLVVLALHHLYLVLP